MSRGTSKSYEKKSFSTGSALLRSATATILRDAFAFLASERILIRLSPVSKFGTTE